jgi:two-component system, LuxR family, response regulator FixJ
LPRLFATQLSGPKDGRLHATRSLVFWALPAPREFAELFGLPRAESRLAAALRLPSPGSTMASERTVHIVEDDAPVRRSLERLLQSEGFATHGYATALACLEAAPRLTEGCLLLDVQMPDMDGLQLQAQLAALGVELPVIVLTGKADVTTAVRAMKAGAVDFLEKPFDPEGLVAAIEAAMEGAGHPAIHKQAAEAAARIATLTPREREVLDGLVAGQINKAMAFEMGISVRTVELHRAHMLGRLGTRRLAEAVRLAVLATLV